MPWKNDAPLACVVVALDPVPAVAASVLGSKSQPAIVARGAGGVAVGLGVADGEGVGEGVGEGEPDAEAARLGLAVPVPVADGVRLGVADAVSEPDGMTEALGVRDGVADGVSVPEDDTEEVPEADVTRAVAQTAQAKGASTLPHATSARPCEEVDDM